jgi:hypothetical protein
MAVQKRRALITAASSGKRRVKYFILTTDEPHLVLALIGDHPPAIVLLLVHPALVVEGAGDLGGVHEGGRCGHWPGVYGTRRWSAAR